jgi:hypothetical protein
VHLAPALVSCDKVTSLRLARSVSVRTAQLRWLELVRYQLELREDREAASKALCAYSTVTLQQGRCDSRGSAQPDAYSFRESKCKPEQ